MDMAHKTGSSSEQRRTTGMTPSPQAVRGDILRELRRIPVLLYY